MFVFVYLQVCGGQRSSLGIIPQVPSSLCFEAASLIGPGLTD